MSQSFYITTLGCQKNVADSREMERSMLLEGFVVAEDAPSADFHLINTCSFIDSAREQTIETVFEAIDVKEMAKSKTDGQKLVVIGCFTERYHDAVKQEWPEVDFSFGTGLYHRAGALIREQFRLPRPHDSEISSPFELIKRREFHPYVPVKIADGCDRKCGFCAIPQFRGQFRTRTIDQVVAECKELATTGIREICLVSQDTNSFGGKPEALVDLIEELNSIDQLRWIRLLYLYPDKKTERILRLLADRGLNRFESGQSKLVPYLESPVQHVSATVIKSMNRYGDGIYFKELFAMARQLFPKLEIRSSFLLGYPGETSADIDMLHRFIEDTRIEKLALFSYSPEEGTTGFDLDRPDTEITKDYINEVRQTHLKVLSEIHLERVGQVYECMVDEVHGKELFVRRPQDAPEVDENVVISFEYKRGIKLPKPGDIMKVEITGFFEYDMEGRRVEP